jgi:hypothetical protein
MSVFVVSYAKGGAQAAAHKYAETRYPFHWVAGVYTSEVAQMVEDIDVLFQWSSQRLVALGKIVALRLVPKFGH